MQISEDSLSAQDGFLVAINNLSSRQWTINWWKWIFLFFLRDCVIRKRQATSNLLRVSALVLNLQKITQAT